MYGVRPLGKGWREREKGRILIPKKNDMRTMLFCMLLCAVSGLRAEYVEPVYEKVPKTFRYRVCFADKKGNACSLKRPQEFLSAKALERRRKYGIKVDEHDLPVTQSYLGHLREQGLRVLHVSKWNNTAVVETADSALVRRLPALPFVTAVRKVWESPDSVKRTPVYDRRGDLLDALDTVGDYYGRARAQVGMIAADRLHEAGFRGEGITIAVIDGGFLNADCIGALKGCKVLGTRDFTGSGRSVYEAQQHGTMVLSCMAADIPHSLVGTAPGASYYLLQSEINEGESMVEEDNWCAAVEYADSLGCDIVTSSLGYYEFDDTLASHRYAELDGRTAINSRSASLAASRGLLVLNSAGNSGNSRWKKIGFPADAKDILTVGAVTYGRKNTLFSSLGNTADGRTKPDVMALGQDAWLLDFTGSMTTANGTSFSTPILCGGVACLLQACPDRRPEEIIEAVCRSGHNAATPDNVYGYGIPDLWKAYRALTSKK